MNTNPDAKTILCFGDSNTWGQTPDKSRRYFADERWTGRLQTLLGDSYCIIEEGLGGRNTDFEHYDLEKLGRNGRQYLVPCIKSHSPVDLVILMLGTNDLKIQYDRSVEEVGASIKALIESVRTYGRNSQGTSPTILVLSPPHLNEEAPNYYSIYEGVYDASSAEKSRKLSHILKPVSKEKECYFIDAADCISAGSDGIHLDLASHERLAEILYKEIKGIFSEEI